MHHYAANPLWYQHWICTSLCLLSFAVFSQLRLWTMLTIRITFHGLFVNSELHLSLFLSLSPSLSLSLPSFSSPLSPYPPRLSLSLSPQGHSAL